MLISNELKTVVQRVEEYTGSTCRRIELVMPAGGGAGQKEVVVTTDAGIGQGADSDPDVALGLAIKNVINGGKQVN